MEQIRKYHNKKYFNYYTCPFERPTDFLLMPKIDIEASIDCIHKPI